MRAGRNSNVVPFAAWGLPDVVQGLKPSVAPKLPADVAEEAIAAVESS